MYDLKFKQTIVEGIKWLFNLINMSKIVLENYYCLLIKVLDLNLF